MAIPVTVNKARTSFTQGILTKVAVNDISSATIPTSAECVTAFGAAADVGVGFIGIINDNAGDANNYLVFSNGTSYYFLKFTKTA